jgi:hypothetical protein
MRVVSVSLLLLLVAPSLRDAESPKATLERAVRACGGPARMARLRIVRATLRVILHMNEKDVVVTGSTTLELPGRLRTEWRLPDGSVILNVLDGESGWVRMVGGTRLLPLHGDALEILQEEVYASYVETLMPLLNETDFTLTTLGESTVNGQPVVGIRVVAKGHKDIELYFDRASHLLVKVARMARGTDGREVRQEAFYSDYRTVPDGPRQPFKARIEQNGKKCQEMEVTEVQLLDRLDDATFARP